MSLDKEEDINTIKKGSIDIKDDQEDGNNSQNLDNNEEVVEGDQLDNLNKEIPDNSQLSDGEERPDTENKLKEEPKTDDYQTVKTKDGEEEEDQADEKEDFADVEISSGSSNAVYLY